MLRGLMSFFVFEQAQYPSHPVKTAVPFVSPHMEYEILSPGLSLSRALALARQLLAICSSVVFTLLSPT